MAEAYIEEDPEIIDITEQEQESGRVNIPPALDIYERDRELSTELDNLHVQLMHNMDERQRMSTRIHTLYHERVLVLHAIGEQVRRGVQRPTPPTPASIDLTILRRRYPIVEANSIYCRCPICMDSTSEIEKRGDYFHRLHGMHKFCSTCVLQLELEAIHENRLIKCPLCRLMIQRLD
jgi:hypothetical protein